MTRRQLTLFLDEAEALPIETIRRRFNPRQYALIGSHITLCREDELGAWSRIQSQLSQLEMDAFALQVGGLKRCSEGKGVLLSVQDGEKKFRKLRALILGGGKEIPRDHTPHITLMHPRNSTCNEAILHEIQQVEFPSRLRITSLSLIEQAIGKKLRILEEYELKRRC